MNEMPNSSQPMQPLSVVKVLSAALRLYRDNHKAYLKIAFQAALWSLLPLFSLLIIIALFVILFTIASLNNLSSLNWGLLGILLLVIPGWIVFVVYCSSKYLVNAALLSRLAFSQLINKPETIQEGRKNIQKLWQFLGLQFIVNLILSFFSLALSIFQGLIFEFPASKIEGGASNLLRLMGNFCYFLGYVWIYARFFIPEVSLGIEQELDPVKAISRSWKLSQGFSWHILLIITVTFLMTIPVYLLSSIPLIMLLVFISPFLQESTFSPAILIGFWTSIAGAIVSTILIFSFLNIAALPLWQSIKGIIYYDLRSRAERL